MRTGTSGAPPAAPTASSSRRTPAAGIASYRVGSERNASMSPGPDVGPSTTSGIPAAIIASTIAGSIWTVALTVGPSPDLELVERRMAEEAPDLRAGERAHHDGAAVLRPVP